MKISASALTTFRECKRKWGWKKLNEIDGPPSPSAEFGTEVHGVLEAWLRDGTPIDTSTRAGKVAASGIQHLPAPGVAKIEEWFNLNYRGIEYHGKVDTQWEENGVYVVEDHKTTRDFKWAKTKEDLLEDEQATLYSAAAMVKHKKQEIENRWVYYITEGAAKSKKVSLVVTREHVDKQMEKIHETATEMIEIANSNKKALDLQPTVTACSNYGGCPYIENCNLSAKEILRAAMAHESLAEKMRKRQEAAGAAQAAPAATEAPAAPAPTPSSNGGSVTKLAAKVAKINPPEAPTQQSTATAQPPSTDAGRRDVMATHMMAASIIRGEQADDEFARAKTAYVRADALMKAR